MVFTVHVYIYDGSDKHINDHLNGLTFINCVFSLPTTNIHH